MGDLGFASDTGAALPLYLVPKGGLADALSGADGGISAWAEAAGFSGKAGEALVVRGADGAATAALVGLGDATDRARRRFVLGGARAKLPKGTYHIANPGAAGADLDEAALGWLLAGYRFDRYKSQNGVEAELAAPDGIDAARIAAIASGEALTRDLINTPSSDMGPAELEAAARALAEEFGADIEVTTGQTLLEQNFPMIHAVGRASPREPRLIDITWGGEGPRLTLVGKGVCFDTGGLNLKPGSSMGLMKKDMGGAATVLGLARMIMATGAKIGLRVLIPAVENSVSGAAFRPQDVLTSRKGLTVEINNTDAEGRLVLADALAYAEEAGPDLIVSMATLTGAARVAVGPDLAPFYTDDDGHAARLAEAAAQVRDPVWRMPFWAPYETMIEPAIADLDNAPSGGFAGSITAALFLRRFVEATPYIHFDIFGWQPTAAPARPKGGVGQSARALFEALPDLLP
ncbi:leucyl aminopeptidase family protein [Ovoidimarina sediminis]|uniref:leucyl aminopeptidase family protein n=1 Tax=Ovoidimarina sediminis TaxID=3079856 RepID=UPI00290C77EC|nr:leucyl aminopeptidase family protein [Rhodophyticola sp. MJ-SS7]MDU8944481.1 leucyl aminopeptidase family protein [Rhodophyticola sp. MJ-SS7]